MNSGDSAIPVIFSCLLAPFKRTPTLSPGRKPCALAKPSLITASCAEPGSGVRPCRMYSRFSTGSWSSGRETIITEAGSAIPSTSASAIFTIRGSTAATPSSASMDAVTDLGARVTLAKISAKRFAS